jgi:adenine-specific DNA-methyltransferase
MNTNVIENESTLVERVEGIRLQVGSQLDRKERSALGQFMTPQAVAQFMVTLFSERPRASIRLLDAGAGVGSLSAAFIAELCQRPEKPQEITVTAYEVDPLLAQHLEHTLEICQAQCAQYGIGFTSRVIQDDFIRAGVSMLQQELFSPKPLRFDYAILNPPYKKINSASQHRKLLRTIGIETSNLYTAFLALVTALLEQDGELVAITPRSFCNGPYFKPFRVAFLNEMNLDRIHVFESRNTAFKDDEVLQENIIFHAVKSTSQPASVTVSSSAGPDNRSLSAQDVAYSHIVSPDDPDFFIHIPTDDIARRVTERILQFTESLKTLGITVSTGRVVDFRAKEYLRADPEKGTVPLIYPCHFNGGFISWPAQKGKKPNALVDAEQTQNLLVPAGWYVLTKRFTSKEEPRRVVASLYDPNQIPANRVGFENHLNYYHVNGEGLTEQLARGLAAFLNSTLVDSYFRLFNGHTQVNATDLRKLRYPTRSQLEELGAEVGDSFSDQKIIDQLIETL